MKLKNKTLLTALIGLSILAGCKKEAQQISSPLANTSNEQSSKRLEIEQSIYNLSPEQTTRIVKSFKAGIKNNISSRLIEADSLALDSSIFVIEAALNYDYDYVKNDNYENSFKTIERSIAVSVNGEKVSSNDIEELYNNFKSAIDSTISDSIKVQVIDMQVYSDVSNPVNPVFYFSASLSYIKLLYITPCGPITLAASPWRSKYLFFGCSSTPITDGPKILNQRLSCGFYTNCNNDYYFTNVTSQLWTANPFVSSPNPYPGALFATIGIGNAFGLLVTSPNTEICGTSVISAAQMNTFRNGCNALANGAIPAGMITLTKKVTAKEIVCSCIPPASAIYWELTVTYGKVNCGVRTD